MAELPVPAELDAPPRTDEHSRYRTFLGKKHTLQDRRRFWAAPERELVAYDEMRKGEQRARRRFWRLVQRGMDPVEALQESIGLIDGPIPEFQTKKQFNAYWTPERLKETADRWKTSRLTQRCAAAPVTTAITMLEDAAPEMAAVLIQTARDPKSKPNDKRQSARDALVLAGAKIDRSVPEKASSPIVLTGNETPEQLEAMLLRVAQAEPDPNRARLMSETIRALLKVKMPEKWGDKLEVKNTGVIGLAGILVDMDARRDAAIADREKSLAIETTAVPEGDGK